MCVCQDDHSTLYSELVLARRLFKRAIGVKVIVSLPGNGERTNGRLNKKTNERTDLAPQGSHLMQLEGKVKKKKKKRKWEEKEEGEENLYCNSEELGYNY